MSANPHPPAWRQDFPTDWPQAHYVARRDFTRFLLLTSLPFAAAQLWIGLSNWLRRAGGRPPAKAVARLDEVPVGGTVTFRYPGDEPCLLVRPDEKTVAAFGQKCTHLGCAVVPEGGRLCCPCHKGYFDLSSGRPLAGPPRRPLPRVTLEEHDGTLYAVGTEVSSV